MKFLEQAVQTLGVATAMIIMVFTLAVVADIIRPYEPIEVEITPALIIQSEVAWEDDINNPDNSEFVIEVAFNNECAPHQVTQDMFNSRYLD